MMAAGRKAAKPRRDLRMELLAHASFPSSRYDGKKFLELIAEDQAREIALGAEYRQSEFLTAAMQLMRKRFSRGATSGLVLVCASYLQEFGLRASLESSSRLASEVSYLCDKFSVIGPGGNQFRSHRMNADHASIKAIFRQYRSVAHVWAAELCMAEPARLGMVAWTSALEKSYVQTARRYQSISETQFAGKGTDFLRVEEICKLPSDKIAAWTHLNGPIKQIHAAFRKLHTEGGVFGLPQSAFA